MITPVFGPTANKRLVPSLALDWTKGLVQPAVDVARAGVATFVGSNGFIQSALADTQRIDYKSGVAALLVEESRTNLIIYSNDFRDTATAGSSRPWVNTAVLVLQNSSEGPDGLVSMSKINETAVTSAHLFSEDNAGNVSQVYSQTIFAKAGERRYLRATIQNVSATGNFLRAHFDLQTGTVIASGVFGSAVLVAATIENFGGGIYRCSLVGSVGTVSASTNIRSSFQLMNLAYSLGSGASYLGVANEGLFVWGAQLEEGAFSTSYIPTEASAVTRNADAVTLSNFSDFWRVGKGSALVKARLSTVSGIRPVLQFDDTTADNIIALRGNAANPELYVRTGGVDQAQIDAGTIAADTSYRLAGAWATNDCAASLNSGTPVLDGVATIPTVTQARIGSDGTNYLNGHIEAIEYYDERLPNSALQVVSSSAGYQSIISPVFRDSIIS